MGAFDESTDGRDRGGVALRTLALTRSFNSIVGMTPFLTSTSLALA
jgi:hypothetical protein